jgi:hypothetical protein
MRLLIILAGLTFATGLLPSTLPLVRTATAAECSGENCPPPAGQGRGHDCHKRQEQPTS